MTRRLRGTTACYLYQGGREGGQDRSLKDQILVIAPHEGLFPLTLAEIKLMATPFQNEKARNTGWPKSQMRKCGLRF